MNAVLSFHRVGPKDSIQIVNGLGEAVFVGGSKMLTGVSTLWLAFFDAECLGFFFGFLSCVHKHLILLFGLMSIFFRISGKLYN